MLEEASIQAFQSRLEVEPEDYLNTNLIYDLTDLNFSSNLLNIDFVPVIGANDAECTLQSRQFSNLLTALSLGAELFQPDERIVYYYLHPELCK
jgi:hypothetical protein